MDRRTFLRGAAGGSAALAAGWGTSGCAPAPIDPGGALPHGLPPASPGRDRWARVPNAFARRVTTDTPTRPLALIEGALPEDLAGHVFFQSISLGPDDTGFGGDGMVWRIDFDGDSPMITSRILRTTDYLMSQAFAATPYRFHPRGVTRLGPLGMQNQTNTALVAMAGNRLIATSDASRPWELDPATLAPVSPVGRLSDYRAIAELPFNRFLCPMIISSAHPPYDLETGEFYGVSMSIVPIPGMMYFELLVWNGEGNLRRVPVLDQNGAPLLISQSAHQLCITRHHVVILDGAGTIEFGKLFDSPFSAAAHQQTTPRPDSSLFVVDRDAIRRTTSSVVARRSVIPREAAHFMADYESSPDRLVLHVPHNSAGDFAEWVQPDDVHPATRRAVRPGLIGVTTPLSYDLGVIGRYEISARTGEVLGRTLVADDRTWGSGGLVAASPRTSPSSGSRAASPTTRIGSSRTGPCRGRESLPAWYASTTTADASSTPTGTQAIGSAGPPRSCHAGERPPARPTAMSSPSSSATRPPTPAPAPRSGSSGPIDSLPGRSLASGGPNWRCRSRCTRCGSTR